MQLIHVLSACRRSAEVAAEKLCCIAAERADLQALLLATLERLEGVEAVVAAADATSAAMEDKVGSSKQLISGYCLGPLLSQPTFIVLTRRSHHTTGHSHCCLK